MSDLTMADERYWTRAMLLDKDGKVRMYGGGGTGTSKDRTARLFDASAGRQVHVFTGDWTEIYSVCWDPKGERICTVTDGPRHGSLVADRSAAAGRGPAAARSDRRGTRAFRMEVTLTDEWYTVS